MNNTIENLDDDLDFNDEYFIDEEVEASICDERDEVLTGSQLI